MTFLEGGVFLTVGVNTSLCIAKMYATGRGGNYGSVIRGTFVAVGNAGAGPSPLIFTQVAGITTYN